MESTRLSDLYATLGVLRTATPAEIRRAYRRQVLRYHPDRRPSESGATEIFQQITEAYQVLSNPERRSAYDALRPTLNAKISTPAPPKPSRVGLRLSYLSAQNPLDQRDAFRGGTFAAALFPLLAMRTSFASPEMSAWGDATWVLVATVASIGGWFLGSASRGAAQRIGETLSHSPEVGEVLAVIQPFFLQALAPWIAVRALSSGLVALPTVGLFGGVLGGAVAGWIASAFGRAFSFASPGEPQRKLGVAIGVIGAFLLGGFIGFLITAATSDVLAGGRFFSLWTCSGGAAALGGAVAAAFGARRAFDGFGQEP